MSRGRQPGSSRRRTRARDDPPKNAEPDLCDDVNNGGNNRVPPSQVKEAIDQKRRNREHNWNQKNQAEPAQRGGECDRKNRAKQVNSKRNQGELPPLKIGIVAGDDPNRSAECF